MGAPRLGDHLRAERQPVPRAADAFVRRPGADGAAADRHRTEKGRAAADRQPEVHSRRRVEAARGGARAEGQEEEIGREGRKRQAARLRSAGPSVCARSDALARRDARLCSRRRASERRAQRGRTQLRERDGLHGRYPGAHSRWRYPGSSAARSLEPEDRQDRVGRRQLRAACRRAHCGRGRGGR